MAGDWIKVEMATPDKPEVWQMAEKMGIDADSVVGKLFRVWSWFDQHTEDGHAASVTSALLDRVVGVTGFCDSMLQVGWLVKNGGTVTMPNFDRHNGKGAKKRANASRRQQDRRKRSSCVTPESQECHAESVTKIASREEKRREDNKTLMSPKAPAVPFDEIVNQYHENLPMLPRVVKITDKRRQWIKARWNESDNTRSVDYWGRFFTYVGESDFLTGNANDERAFKADFEWLMNASNFVKVCEGKYHK